MLQRVIKSAVRGSWCGASGPLRQLATKTSGVKVLRRAGPVASRAPIVLTPAAVQRLRALLAREPTASGLRIGVKTRGCNGLAYTLDFAFERKPSDECVEQDGVRVFIDPKAQLSIFGTEMDFHESKLSSEFVFKNPNVKGFCGCGESFNV